MPNVALPARRGEPAHPATRSTMPRAPPLRAMMPTKPPIMKVKTMRVAWPASVAAATTYTPAPSNKPCQTLANDGPAMRNAPNHTATKSAGITCRSTNARPMATNGGNTESQPGRARRCATASVAPAPSKRVSCMAPVGGGDIHEAHRRAIVRGRTAMA